MKNFISTIGLILCVSIACNSQDEPRVTLPPGNKEPDEIRKLIDAAQAELESGQNNSHILSSEKWMPARSWPRFRGLIRTHASSAEVMMVPDTEQGSRLFVEGRVTDRQGKPVKQALVYLYHTSAKGWYSDKAAHISGNSGDYRHARLFTYLKTDDEGRFAFKTIRPASYPQTDLPQHIHLDITRPGAASPVLLTEIQFEDDPHLTPAKRAQSQQHGYVVTRPVKQNDGSFKAKAELQLKD